MAHGVNPASGIARGLIGVGEDDSGGAEGGADDAGSDNAVADGAGGLIASAADNGDAGEEAYGHTRFTG